MDKRILSLLLSIFMTFGVFSSVSAENAEPINAAQVNLASGIVEEGVCGDNLTYTIDSNYTLTITGVGDMYNWASDVDIPWYIYTYAVENIVIEEGVKGIGNNAFNFFTALKSISIPSSVLKIGTFAFRFCENLAEINIPKGVKVISNYAFEECVALTSVTIPENVVSIGPGAFSYCTSLEEATINANIKSIPRNMFAECCNLNRVTIPVSVTNIAENAFDCCDSLRSVYYGGSSEEWNNISIVSGNDILTNVAIYFADADVPEPEILKGDVTDDGIVNRLDLLRLGKYFGDWDVDVNINCADVTGDGIVNRLDLLRLGKYLSGWDVVLE